MTALDERTATLPTPEEIRLFHDVARRWTDQPGDADGRTRAGLAAVLQRRLRPATGPVHGLFPVPDIDDANALRRAGWTIVGVGCNPLSGAPVYVLERTQPEGDPAPADGAP
jgi:hypothetical protein